MKTRPFSIYLLKQGFNSSNALMESHSLQEAVEVAQLPEGAILYILDAQPKRPWWRDYFGVQEDLWQNFKGALLFLPVGRRCFALSFGQVFHHLKDEAYEYDFGLRVTLNSLDPNELKSADMLEPGSARRKRTQVPISTELTYLDFDGNSEIIKSLTGKIKREYSDLFSTATGSASLKISMKIAPDMLTARCESLLSLYESSAYKDVFPNIQNIVPVKDPTEISRLDALLLDEFKNPNGTVMMALPDIVDYRDDTCCRFDGPAGQSNIYPDISMEAFYNYLGVDYDFSSITLKQLKSSRVVLTDLEGTCGRSYSLYRSLIFDVHPTDEQVLYHFNEGDWYKAQTNFVERLKSYLDAKCETTNLCAYNHDEAYDGKAVYSEGNYNAAIPVWKSCFICLDQTDISPAGSSNIEPCDLYSVLDDRQAKSRYRAFLYHIKISTRSSNLSHLFNQGVNSIELIELEETSREKMKNLVTERLGVNQKDIYLKPFDHFDFKVIFGIITDKDPMAKSSNLPLFSKISLMRNMQRLDLMRVPSALTFIPDESPTKGAHDRHPQFYVEVYPAGDDRKEIRAHPEQGLDITVSIKRCPLALKKAAVGKIFRIGLREGKNNSLYSHPTWQYEEVN
ncbi:DUF6119 family protein [Acetobacter cibinongensis]|uniref:Sporadically distributed protein, TIGR04141 family n=1 Tax=Acetobacter cibinongensis TaxID=146475 RepID=A0A1Z5YS41_9PROT|nr:DUF6119 family protein [Acetobacter cibinongensis]OUJ00559.1 hypothetical protein HK14_12150 [Acetobacter cibinongensis]